MTTHLKIGKTGATLGIILGGWHLAWSILVASGWAQAVINFVFWMHFIKPIYVIEPFEIVRAAVLVGVTAVIGILIGSLFAFVWNCVVAPERPDMVRDIRELR